MVGLHGCDGQPVLVLHISNLGKEGGDKVCTAQTASLSPASNPLSQPWVQPWVARPGSWWRVAPTTTLQPCKLQCSTVRRPNAHSQATGMAVAAVLPHVSEVPALSVSAMCGCPMQPATVCSGAKPDSLTSRNLFEKAKANVLPGGRDVPDTAWRRLLVAVQQARSCQELYRLYRTNVHKTQVGRAAQGTRKLGRGLSGWAGR
ncbi:hypothetical protein V8C86DRAFT_2914755 [Haematococcus lacustris]